MISFSPAAALRSLSRVPGVGPSDRGVRAVCVPGVLAVLCSALAAQGRAGVASPTVPNRPGRAIDLDPRAGGASCASWLPTFGGEPGTNAEIHGLAVFDDGNGPALYAGGMFTNASGVAASRVARWDGTGWSALRGGINTPSQVGQTVNALLAYDDGSGPALYVGGLFRDADGMPASGIARWDGTQWSTVGAGLFDVGALCVYDDGSGPALYAGGRFSSSGGVSTNLVAKWDGTSWSGLGVGLSGTSSLAEVLTLAVYDDGSGPALFAGGDFNMAGGAPASYLARWDGTSWSDVGGGLSFTARAMVAHDDGSGPALFVAGSFTSAGGVSASRIAKWDGTSWTRLRNGTVSTIHALSVYDDGGGAALYAGGVFTSASGAGARRVARWDGAAWSGLGTGLNHDVFALAPFDDGSGPALYVGGTFSVAGDVSALRFARWKDSVWSAFGDGLHDPVTALETYDDGSGPALYVAGLFTRPLQVPSDRVARWDGSGFSSLGVGPDAEVRALEVFDDGGGPALYAGGDFTHAGGGPANRIARWDGTGWAPLGSGIGTGGVYALAEFDDGGGPALIAGGAFTTAGGVPANRVARWDGASWAPLGAGFDFGVLALAVHDDGGGPALYAGGGFLSSGGVSARRIARWNGSTWTQVGSGTNDAVFSLVEHDDGSGPALYAGGVFTSAEAMTMNYIARWKGGHWSSLGGGMNFYVNTLCSYDDGSGRALFAGGLFSTAGGAPASRIARWDGVSWGALGSGANGTVNTLVVHDAGRGPALFVGGEFGLAPDAGDSFLAQWGLDVLELDFSLEDDFATPLVNGQDISSPPEFGRLVSISSSGPNAGAALFDSTPGGPNDPSQDRDLLVGSGNILILQTDANTTQTVPGVFDRPNDDEDGGTLVFQFSSPVSPVSLALIDIDAGADELSFVVLTDAEDRTRTYTVPPDWTGDLLTNGAGKRTLDLRTLDLQPGLFSTVTATEASGFDLATVTRIEVRLGSSGGVDELRWCPSPPEALDGGPRGRRADPPPGPVLLR